MTLERVFLPSKLRLARSFMGHSLEDVGLNVAASKQYIQQIESGAKEPSEEMVLALADALFVHPEFFFKNGTFQATEDQSHFRSRKTTPVSSKNQALAHATLLDELIHQIEKVMDFPPLNLPQYPAPKSFDDVETYSEKLREHWGLGLTAPITNMVRVLERAGVVVAYFKDISEKVDAFSVHGRRPLVIRNPSKESICRMRFDLAHECGHLVMHLDQITGDKRTEDEANRFASAFLIPKAAFLKEFPRGSRIDWVALFNMKIKWKVSVAALIRRAYDLSIIDAAHYRRAHIHLSKTGQSRQEKYDDRPDIISPEEPELVHHCFKMIEEQAPKYLTRFEESIMVRTSIIEHLINRKIAISSYEDCGSNIVRLK